MKKQLKIYENLAQSLANLFQPMVEVALLDPSNKTICTFNCLTKDALPKITENEPTKILINKKQQAKAMLIPLENNFQLRLIVEISMFESLQIFLQQYLFEQSKGDELLNWQQVVEDLICDYLKTHRTSLSALSVQEKRSLVLLIQEKNLLRYQDATKYLANKLEVSRATIYNYLNQASQFKSLEIHQVDAFTEEPFSGNPAGVVLDASQLSDVMMKKIAREMNLSETSFLLPSQKADIRLRYFTPNGSEVKFCGHSTVGALYMLAHKKMLGIEKPGHYDLKLEANVGIIQVGITVKADDSITVEFRTPKIELINSKITFEEISQALGIPLSAINLKKPIMFDKVNQDLFVTISTLKDLEALQVDQESAKRFAERHNIVAYALICNQTISKNSHISMRCYAPAVGIPEDPFTGSVLGGLSAYIRKNKLISEHAKTIRIEQGHFMQRPGFVEVKLGHRFDDPPLVIAKAHHFFSTQINL